jgi:hypothetical protein
MLANQLLALVLLDNKLLWCWSISFTLHMVWRPQLEIPVLNTCYLKGFAAVMWSQVSKNCNLFLLTNMSIISFQYWSFYCHHMLILSICIDRGSVVVEVLCCKPEGLGFKTWWGEWIFSIYLILPATLNPWIYSASNRYEYQKQKINVSGK